MTNFTVLLSNTQPTVGISLDTSTCTLCYQYIGSVDALTGASVNCPLNLSSFRYVIIQGHADALCTIEVEVYSGR
jgi:hypothetical protein